MAVAVDMFLLQECGKTIEPVGAELFVTIEPFEGVAHRLGLEAASNASPGLLLSTSPASNNTSRCFITAGSDIGNGAASR